MALNIAEGSTGLTNKEQIRFLCISLRSLIETVATLRIIEKRQLIAPTEIEKIEMKHSELFNRIQTFINSLENSNEFREPHSEYGLNQKE